MRAVNCILACTLAVIGVLVPACGRLNSGAFKMIETRLGTFDIVDLPVFSPDGRHVAWSAQRDEKKQKWCVVVDGVAGAEYDQINTQISLRDSYNPVFSPDGKHVVYSAKKDTKWTMVVDNQEGAEYDAIGDLIFSPDGKHLAYVADGRLVVLDGLEEGNYGRVAVDPVFSPDSRHLAYLASTGRGFFLVLDGQVDANSSGIRPGTFAFSPDSKHTAYVVDSTTAAGDFTGKHFVVVDGHADAEYDDVYPPPFFSPDGKRVAYVASLGGKQFLVVDGQAGARYDSVNGSPMSAGSTSVSSPLFSPDGKHIACAAKKNNKCLVVVDGQPGAEYDYIGSLIFSPDSKHFAYVAFISGGGLIGTWPNPTKDTRVVVVDGHEDKAYAQIGESIAFSPDGKRLEDGDQNGPKVADQKLVVSGDVSTSPKITSPDQKHVAYELIGASKWMQTPRMNLGGVRDACVVLDGQAGPLYDGSIGNGTVGNGSPILPINFVTELAKDNSIYLEGSVYFRDDGVVEYLAVEKGSLYRVQLVPVR
jgi:Tol biopolymer transport system component